MIEAMIFDRDGVIIDSERVHIESVEQSLKAFKLKFNRKDFEFMMGVRPDDYKEIFLKKYPVDWEKYRALQRTKFYEILSKEHSIKEVVSLVRELKRRKYKLGMATSSRKEPTTKILKLVGLEKAFDAIVTMEECTKRKPNPEPYLKAAEKLKVEPKKCLVFEDSQIGLESAKAAGMKCIIIKTNDFKQDFSKADMVLEQKEVNFQRIKSFIKGD